MQSGKRQRRQAAALVVQSLWSSNSKKKPASPKSAGANAARPAIEVPPMGFGPIREPNPNDVLCGRGGLINGSVGNVQFRTIVSKRKKEYNAKTTKRHEKAHMAAEIVRQIRSMNPPGRFLREDASGLWFDVGDARAIRKTGQALREAAPAIRNEGEGGEAGKEDDKVSDSGSEEGKKEEEVVNASDTGSPKRKKDETPPKEPKSKKQSPERTRPVQRASAPALGAPDVAALRNSTSRQSTGRRSWLPSMSMRRSSNHNNNSDAASVSADTVRSSQTYLIPQSALGPHITNTNAAMPRMSPGAIFSNSHPHRRSATEQPQQHAPPHPYPHAHYPYPYAHPMPPPMHPHMQYPPHMQQHPHQHPHYPHQQQSAVPGVLMYPMMRPPQVGSVEEDAFGMNFFPTRDVQMDRSENGSQLTVSDISGLSSAMTPGDHQRKHHAPPKLPLQYAKKPTPTTPSTIQHQQLLLQVNNMEEASMLDTTSSLPSFSDILDDVDVDMASATSGMASATSGGANGSSLAMASISSSSVAKMMMAPPPPVQIPGYKKHGATIMKENSGSCLSGKGGSELAGSCLSGKSELSLPSSCGTALSQFSDSFMAMHLSDHNEFE